MYYKDRRRKRGRKEGREEIERVGWERREGGQPLWILASESDLMNMTVFNNKKGTGSVGKSLIDFKSLASILFFGDNWAIN